MLIMPNWKISASRPSEAVEVLFQYLEVVRVGMGKNNVII